MSAEATTLWARAFVDELARSGVEEVVLAPGSRSTPLVLATARDERLRMRVHLDERSAAFFALGVGRATGRPAAVVTTSGTATANLFGAVVEASQAEVPLLLLTADRPPRLRGADANQAIDQNRLFGPYPRAFFETAAPELSGPAVRHLRAQACRAVAVALGPPAGPVHVNLPFDKPLEPVEAGEALAAFAAEHPAAAEGRGDGKPFVAVRSGRARPGPDELEAAAEAVRGARRGLIVAGPTSKPDAPAGREAVRFAAATGFPLLADPLSGARFGDPDGAVIVPAYDLFLRDAAVRSALAPDLVVRVGASPTSAALQRFLFHHHDVPQVVLDGGHRWKDHGATASTYVEGDPGAALRSLRECGAPVADAAWNDRWRRVSAAAAGALRGRAPMKDDEGRIVEELVAALPPGTTLLVSNSMPVRDLDAFGLPRPEPLAACGNRGASGIDGIVSTAFGLATRAPTVCVIGDLAFFHDQNGLLWSREPDAPVVFLLVDNDGGGIFHMLPVREREPHFTPYFATPHGLDFSHAAAAHGIPLADATPDGAAAATLQALAGGGSRVVRVRTDRDGAHAARRAAQDAVCRSVHEALG